MRGRSLKSQENLVRGGAHQDKLNMCYQCIKRNWDIYVRIGHSSTALEMHDKERSWFRNYRHCILWAPAWRLCKLLCGYSVSSCVATLWVSVWLLYEHLGGYSRSTCVVTVGALVWLPKELLCGYPRSSCIATLWALVWLICELLCGYSMSIYVVTLRALLWLL